MKGLTSFLFVLGVMGAGLFGTPAGAEEEAVLALQPALLNWSAEAAEPELQLVSGRHRGHGGHRHHLDRPFIHPAPRHFHHFDHRHFIHGHDHHFIHPRPWLHRAPVGVSFCIRSSGVLFCFNDRVHPYRYY